MAIHGSLEEVPLPDVLQLLALGKKTGCLSLSQGAMRGHIYLEQGRVCDATVIDRPDRVGDALVKRGRITREALAQAAMPPGLTDSRTVGQRLVDSGQVPRTEVEQLVRGQVEDAVYFLFTWRQGEFMFTRDARSERSDFPVSIDAESLLLEGARRVDEWSVIQKKIPSFDLTFRLDKDPRADGSHELTDEQQRLLPLVDGARDVAGLVEASGLSEFDVGKALYGLITAGFAKLIERRVRVRHLEQGQLLAYLVREGEFADPVRRRQAASHIADCSTCAARLKTIHVRRTQEVAIPTETTLEVAPGGAAVARPGPSASPDWSGMERRMGTDRRKGDQRTGDRRQVHAAKWLDFNPERRAGGERRAQERRLADRRHAPRGRAGAAPRRSSGSRSRTAGARRTPTAQPRPATPPVSAPPTPAPVDPEKTVEVTPLPAAKTPDIEWLVTPEQSLELIRASRGVLVPRVPGAARKPGPPPPVIAQPVPPVSISSQPATAAPAPVPAPSRQPAPATPRKAAPAPRPARSARPSFARRRWLAGVAGVALLAGGTVVARALWRGNLSPVAIRVADRQVPAAPVAEPERVATVPLSDSATRAESRPPEAGSRAAVSSPPPAPAVAAAATPAMPRPGPIATAPARSDTQPAPTARSVPADSPAVMPPTTVTRDSQPAPPVAVVTPPVATPPPVEPRRAEPAEPKREEPPSVVAAETDPELLAGTWVRTSRGEAEVELGRGIVAVAGLPIASIARPGAGGRPGIRIVQTLDSGQPLELVITRPAFLNRAGATPGPDRVTAVRVAAPDGAGGLASGSARLGGYLITAKASVPADELKALLARLAQVVP